MQFQQPLEAKSTVFITVPIGAYRVHRQRPWTQLRRQTDKHTVTGGEFGAEFETGAEPLPATPVSGRTAVYSHPRLFSH